MKIVIAGSFRHWNALERHYFDFLKPLVREIRLYPWSDTISDYYNSNLLKKIRYRTKTATQREIKRFNSRFLDYLKLVKPDLVWVFKGVDMLPETILHIKELGIKVVNYNPDHPFIRTFRSGGGAEIEKALPLYDLVFSYSRDLMSEIENRFEGTVKTEYLPFGYRIMPSALAKLESINLDTEEELSICFIGNPDTELRYHLLNELIRSDFPIDIYGSGWHKYFGKGKRKAKIFPGVYQDEYWCTLKRYRAQLNIFRPHNINAQNMRTFEIPAVGGIQIAPESEEHRTLFNPDSEIFLYKDVSNILEHAEHILSLAKAEAYQLRMLAVARCQKDGYAYESRTKIVYESFKSLLGEA